jgi:hydroxymethylpyrimidine pyrophosphatase-like HAD family hydrolase
LLNGVLIYDPVKKEYVKINAISADIVDMVVDTLREFEITGFMYELRNNELFTYHEALEKEPLRDFVKERMARYRKTLGHTDSFADVSNENIIYFTLRDTRDKLQPIYDRLSVFSGLNLTLYNDVYSPDLWLLEIFSAEASKKNAVLYLREKYGYEKVICFGDNYNDLPMFEVSDISVATENAKQEVKDKADFVCEANFNDGVVKWIEGDFTNA